MPHKGLHTSITHAYLGHWESSKPLTIFCNVQLTFSLEVTLSWCRFTSLTVVWRSCESVNRMKTIVAFKAIKIRSKLLHTWICTEPANVVTELRNFLKKSPGLLYQNTSVEKIVKKNSKFSDNVRWLCSCLSKQQFGVWSVVEQWHEVYWNCPLIRDAWHAVTLTNGSW